MPVMTVLRNVARAMLDAMPSLKTVRATEEDAAGILVLVSHFAGTPEAEAAEAAGVTEARIRDLARRIAADTSDFGQAIAELERAVGIAVEVQARGQAGSGSGDIVDAVLARMAELSVQGRDDAAAAEADRAFADWQERPQPEPQTGIALLEAGLRADLLCRDAVSAALRIVHRIDIEAPDDPGAAFEALRRAQHDWYARGRDQGLNLDLEVSIALARLSASRAGNWGRAGDALNDLGAALQTLGARETGTARLEEAVDVFRAALEEHTRGRAPLDWAMIQNNLGAVLRTLGERENDLARMEEAVDAYRAALEERTRDRAPLDWAITQYNLGIALQDLGASRDGAGRLEEAVDAYSAALVEQTRNRAPLLWAAIQNNLGNALQTLGNREGNTRRLEAAVDAYCAALEERTRDRAPLDWALTQSNLGAALAMMGENESGTARLGQAVAAFRAALEEYSRAHTPLDWAMTAGNHGSALLVLAERMSDPDLAQQASDQLAEAEIVLQDGGQASSAELFAARRVEADALIERLADQA